MSPLELSQIHQGVKTKETTQSHCKPQTADVFPSEGRETKHLLL